MFENYVRTRHLAGAHSFQAEVDEQGRLVLPADAASLYGLKPGAQVQLDQDGDGLHLRLPLTHLAKVYVEPSNRCNLACRTCMRNAWHEPLGDMAWATFERLLSGLEELDTAPLVFFGGLGEPLIHERILDMVSGAKALGCRVELITNATLLNESMARRLVDAGLDRLWASLDGASPTSYADVRLGATLPTVIANLERFSRLCNRRVELGINFVAMRRNIADLPRLAELAERLGVSRLLVSNLLPHSAAMAEDVASTWAQTDPGFPGSLEVALPRMDWNEATGEPLYQVLRLYPATSIAGHRLDATRNRCPFVEAGATAVRWDGSVSPCLPLLHEHTYVLNRYERRSLAYSVGNLAQESLRAIWEKPDYLALRQRLREFSFAPCTACGGCYLSETNEEDCFGNLTPACGGCPWSQGVIQCP
jgi:MoaA/NifB/PqqE/SkfB family radical SAM enzyme